MLQLPMHPFCSLKIRTLFLHQPASCTMHLLVPLPAMLYSQLFWSLLIPNPTSLGQKLPPQKYLLWTTHLKWPLLISLSSLCLFRSRHLIQSKIIRFIYSFTWILPIVPTECKSSVSSSLSYLLIYSFCLAQCLAHKLVSSICQINS